MTKYLLNFKASHQFSLEKNIPCYFCRMNVKRIVKGTEMRLNFQASIHSEMLYQIIGISGGGQDLH